MDDTATDALIALREAIKSQTPITYATEDGSPTAALLSASHLVLSPSFSLPKSTHTRYRKPGASSTDPTAAPADFFTVEAVYLAWLLRDAPGAEYMKQARENGLAVGFVSVTERKSLVDWLEGRVQDHERIVSSIGAYRYQIVSDYLLTYVFAVVSNTPPGSPVRGASTARPLSTPRLGAAEPTATTSPTKRRYVADAQDVEAVKKIKANEVELRDRNTVLRGVKANNFSAIRTVYTEKLKKLRDNKPGASGAAAAPSAGTCLIA